ncbi:hypothetical protein [Nonomuraea lactucae]|uniref:hypothetical protein n=1 Tax=Nonomuraea lactucae TaxID=2249762 RepID=UPI000DE38016|nr:hypothetical protein [Nonomuraea lactucae]
MASEEFYVTAAQVLPTLLIALSVEIGFILQRLLRRGIRHLDAYEETRFEDVMGSVARWFTVNLVLGCAFLVGEVLAFLSIGFRWFNSWTCALIGLCVLTMTVGVVVVPLVSAVRVYTAKE